MRTLFSTLMLVGVATGSAHAVTWFGDEDRLYTIQDLRISPLAIERGDVPAEWADGVVLAHRVTTRRVVLGVHAQDAGYVVKAARDDRFWEINARETARLQRLGVLPDPLPRYATPVVDLVLGFSFWIVAIGIGAFTLARRLSRRRRLAAPPEAGMAEQTRSTQNAA